MRSNTYAFPIAFLEEIEVKAGKKSDPFVELRVSLNTEGKVSTNDQLERCEGSFDDAGFSEPISLRCAPPDRIDLATPDLSLNLPCTHFIVRSHTPVCRPPGRCMTRACTDTIFRL
jgi:hypothetical protein